jgi:hypothetical protein
MLAIVTASAAGDTTVIPAVANKKIRVKSLQLANQVATAQSVKLRSGTTDLHAALPLSAATAVTGLIVYSLE